MEDQAKGSGLDTGQTSASKIISTNGFCHGRKWKGFDMIPFIQLNKIIYLLVPDNGKTR